jgi:hypothetical protein
MHNRKGIIDIEFILSIVVFLSVVAFVSFVIIGNVPVFHRESVNEGLRARAYEVSQLILFDQGYPLDWTPSNVQRVGLSTDEAYKISTTKIGNFAALCADYSRMRPLLGQDFRNDVKVSIVDLSGQSLLSCGPAVNTSIVPEFPLTRYAVLENNAIVRISVSVI